MSVARPVTTLVSIRTRYGLDSIIAPLVGVAPAEELAFIILVKKRTGRSRPLPSSLRR
jgi:hypothetical protein